MDGYDEHGFPETTDFDADALGIDPVGCGCTDCLVGYSVPFDSPRMNALADAYVAGRRIVNRTNYMLVLVERFDGTMKFEEVTAQTVIATFPVM